MTLTIPEDAQLPRQLSLRHGLFCLYALQQWQCLTQPTPPYKPGYFYNNLHGILTGLGTTSRATTLKHIDARACALCAMPVDLTKTVLDHLMPQSKGGPDHLDNTLLLCKACNSSKGAKDLLAWWMFRGLDPATIDRRILCLYARVYWQYTPQAALRLPAEASLAVFLLALEAATLPGDAHRIALHGAAYAACALSSWLALPARMPA